MKVVQSCEEYVEKSTARVRVLSTNFWKCNDNLKLVDLLPEEYIWSP
jgi:hypothetical protein